MTTIDLREKVAIVTGGGQGIGEAICRQLYAAGAKVIVNYFSDESGENSRKAEALCRDLGDRAVALSADVRVHSEIEQLCNEVLSRFGSLHIVVNNAGIIRDRSLKKMSVSEWQAVIDTNLTGVFHCCQVFGQAIEPKGRIINISSLSAALGFFGQANYAAAKAGVSALTKVVARELAVKQILVNAIAPGVVQTDMADTIPIETRQKMLEQIPLQRFAERDEIAKVALFLASDLSSYMTGQTLHVNGGWHFSA